LTKLERAEIIARFNTNVLLARKAFDELTGGVVIADELERHFADATDEMTGAFYDLWDSYEEMAL
jgi:hypothetical protein